MMNKVKSKIKVLLPAFATLTAFGATICSQVDRASAVTITYNSQQYDVQTTTGDWEGNTILQNRVKNSFWWGSASDSGGAALLVGNQLGWANGSVNVGPTFLYKQEPEFLSLSCPLGSCGGLFGFQIFKGVLTENRVGSQAGYTFAWATPTVTSVPEPDGIAGTLVGGAVALGGIALRRKFKANTYRHN